MQSAFQVAVAANQHLIVQDLVSLGAQVNTTDCWGRTPLHVCAEKGHAQVLQVRSPVVALSLVLAVTENSENTTLSLIFLCVAL